MSDLEAAVLISGGIDSAACAYLLRARGHVVRGIFFDYGQASAVPERRAVETLAAQLCLPLDAHAIPGAPGFSSGELVGRNAFLIFSAIFLARCHKGLLSIGIHAGTPYYDCSPTFFNGVSRLVAEHTDGALKLVAPFLNWNKGQIFDYFRTTGLSLDATYSCEAGGDGPCGNCASCRDRRALGC